MNTLTAMSPKCNKSLSSIQQLLLSMISSSITPPFCANLIDFFLDPICFDSIALILRGFDNELDSILTDSLIVSGSTDAETTDY